MPTLPTRDVTAAQGTRIMAAYSPRPGATRQEVEDFFVDELTDWVMGRVLAFEIAQRRQADQAAELALEAEIRAALPKRRTSV